MQKETAFYITAINNAVGRNDAALVAELARDASGSTPGREEAGALRRFARHVDRWTLVALNAPAPHVRRLDEGGSDDSHRLAC